MLLYINDFILILSRCRARTGATKCNWAQLMDIMAEAKRTTEGAKKRKESDCPRGRQARVNLGLIFCRWRELCAVG